MRKLEIIILASLLSACAKTIWEHPYKDNQAFYQDSSRCMSMSSGSYRGPELVDVIGARIRENSIYDSCMRGAGWHPQGK